MEPFEAEPHAHRLAFLREVLAEFAAMRSTRYQHTTEVNAERGEYFYDCSGLIEYALARSVPEALRALPTTSKARPLAVNIVWHLLRAPTYPDDPWRAVHSASELQPGDLIAWVTPRGSRSTNTGHVMVVTAAPTRSAQRCDEWLVAIVDSTSTPHAEDSRSEGSTGLGSGTVGLVVDAAGRPTAYRWRGGESPRAPRTLVALGRLREEHRVDGNSAVDESSAVDQSGAERRCWVRRLSAMPTRSGPVAGTAGRAW
jgi:hypothetical protein